MTWYYLSLGSNLQPEKNIAATIHALSERFGTLLLLPIVRTSPCNMESTHDFLNCLVILHSTLDPVALKAMFNGMEEDAGRDRSDPERSSKDRPIDIDIISSSKALSLAPFYSTYEPYCLVSLHALEQQSAGKFGHTVAVPLTPTQLAGERAATINANHSSGHVFIVEDTIDSLFQRLKAAFSR